MSTSVQSDHFKGKASKPDFKIQTFTSESMASDTSSISCNESLSRSWNSSISLNWSSFDILYSILSPRSIVQ